MRRVPAKLLIHVAANAKHVPDMVAQLIQSGTVPVADFLNPQVLLYADEEAYSTIIAIEARSTRLRVWHFAQTHLLRSTVNTPGVYLLVSGSEA